MATATATPTRPARSRGRQATHSDEELLALVAGVARAAAADPQCAVRLPERISMAAFNAAKLDFDRARGIADPRNDPERTPTANAILMRLAAQAPRGVKWRELVAAALSSDATMWMTAARREEPRTDLTDALVSHALRLVAAHRGAATLTRREYSGTRDPLVDTDEERNGEEGLLGYLLPSANQVLAYCGGRWENALKLAGLLSDPETKARCRPPTQRRPPMNPVEGVGLAQMCAFYSALNRHWPSYATLLHFARSCGARMANKEPGPWADIRTQAAALLRAEGVAVPQRTRGGGKGKRLTYRYPVDGIPGAPARDAEGRREQLRDDQRLRDLRREFALTSLRVWLADTPANSSRSRSAYVTWQRGRPYLAASRLPDYGGFATLRDQAAKANARARRAGGDPLSKATERAAAIRSEVARIVGGGVPDQPEPVAFGEALRTVLAGPHAEAQPPRQ